MGRVAGIGFSVIGIVITSLLRRVFGWECLPLSDGIILRGYKCRGDVVVVSDARKGGVSEKLVIVPGRKLIKNGRLCVPPAFSHPVINYVV